MRQKQILIVRPDGIGDFIMFSAVLEEYARLYQGHAIDLLCRPPVRDLAETIPFIRKVICLDPRILGRKKHFLSALLTRARAGTLRYDTVIYPVYSRSKNDDCIVHAIRAGEKIAFDGDEANAPTNERTERDRHFTRVISGTKTVLPEIERNCEFINALGGRLKSSALRTKIWYAPKDEPDVAALKARHALRDGDYIVLFPGALHPEKYWHTAGWVRLLNRLSQKRPKAKIVLTGTGADSGPIGEILKALGRSPEGHIVNLYGRTPIRLLAKVIEGARLFIGTDSAAIHLAAAVGTPNVCIMGGGHFGRFYPYGDLNKNKMVHKMMDCYGCRWQCRYDTVRCLQEIKEETVFEEAERFL